MEPGNKHQINRVQETIPTVSARAAPQIRNKQARAYVGLEKLEHGSKGWRYTENQDEDSCLKQVRMEGPCVTLETADYCPCSQSPVERKRDGNTLFGRLLSSTRPAACLSPRKTCPGCIPSMRAFLVSSLPLCLNIHSLSPQQVYYIRYVSPHFCPIQSLSEPV